MLIFNCKTNKKIKIATITSRVLVEVSGISYLLFYS